MFSLQISESDFGKHQTLRGQIRFGEVHVILFDFMRTVWWRHSYTAKVYAIVIAFTICILSQPTTHLSEWCGYLKEIILIFLFQWNTFKHLRKEETYSIKLGERENTNDISSNLINFILMLLYLYWTSNLVNSEKWQ